MGFRYIDKVESKITQSKHLLYAFTLVISLFTPLVACSSTATASASFTNYPLTTGYKNTAGVTTAGGSLWYGEVDPGAPDSYTVYDIGNITTSGTVTDYNLRTLSGHSSLTVTSLTTGPDGNVWFSAYEGNSALAGVLNISTGTVTLYPSSIPTYGEVGQIASGSDGNLYYYVHSANDGYFYIIYLNPTTGVTGTDGHSGSGSNYTSLAASPDGFLWVTDAGYNRVLAYPVVSGSGGSNYSLPTGDTSPGNITYGPDGSIWLSASSTSGLQILKMTRSSGAFSSYTASAQHLISGPDGAVWFVDSSASTAKIGRISSSGNITEYSIPGTGVYSVNGLTLGPDGAMWFPYYSSGLKMGRVIAAPDFTNFSTTSSYTVPRSVTTANGSLWYLEGTTSAPNDSIGNMTTSGTVVDYNISVPVGATTFSIKSITTGPDGNVWFDGCANTTGSLYAGSLNTSTGAVTFYKNTRSGISCNLGGSPGAIATGPDGYIWYIHDNYEAPGDTGYIFSVNPSTGATTSSYKTGVNWIASSLTAGPDGRLWYTLPTNNAIYAYTVSAGVATGSSVYFAPTLSSYLTSATAGPDGNVWFTEPGASPRKIAKVTPSGTVTEYSMATGVYPDILTTGSDGAVWFVDNVSSSTHKIGRISSSGNITEYTVPGTSVSNVNGLSLGPDGAMWFSYYSGGSKLGRLGY